MEEREGNERRREGKGKRKREGKWEVKEKRIGRDKEWGRGGEIGVVFFPNVGKNLKTSISYVSLPFLLHFASFSVESSLPFSCLPSPFPFLLFSWGCTPT